MSTLAGKHIVLGLSGGIAAFKTAELCRALVKAGVTVQVVMTEAAEHFIGAVTMQALSNRSVYTSQWDQREPNAMAHINLTRQADAVLVAPASADFMAKLAQGSADELLSLLCLARPMERCPLLLAPAMNRQMWENPATRRNIAQLRRDGIVVLGPDEGTQACGETGMGRMLEPADLVEELIGFFQPKLLPGVRVLLTAGPTFETIDAVRGITNLSSGKMGYSVARAAVEAGAQVTLVSGQTGLKPPRGVKVVDVVSAQQMLNAVTDRVDEADIFISVAAVADYYVTNPSEQKIKKDAHILTLELAPNPDILANVVNLPKAPFCVGFAAESENLLEFAEAKRKRKKLPLLAANQVQTAINREDNELILLDDDGQHPLPRGPKIDVARKLVAHIAKLYKRQQIAKAKP